MTWRHAGRLTELELAALQISAIDAWHSRRNQFERSVRSGVASQIDAVRQLAVLERQQHGIVERTRHHLSARVRMGSAVAATRVVVVHRNAWFTEKICAGLLHEDVEVVARLVDGAEAVGVVVAEQPDLVLVEDALPIMSGAEVLREVRRHAPHAVLLAQVDYADRVDVLLAAGAREAYTRQVPPSDVAARVVALLAGCGTGDELSSGRTSAGDMT